MMVRAGVACDDAISHEQPLMAGPRVATRIVCGQSATDLDSTDVQRWRAPDTAVRATALEDSCTDP